MGPLCPATPVDIGEEEQEYTTQQGQGVRVCV